MFIFPFTSASCPYFLTRAGPFRFKRATGWAATWPSAHVSHPVINLLPPPLHLVVKQTGDKSKKPAKVKAPDINDEEFPGLPGMAPKPKSDEAGDGEDGETADADGEGDGDEEGKPEKVRPTWDC